MTRSPGQGPAGLGRLLGKGLEASDLCAVLSGNIPDAAPSSSATLLCGQERDCTLELRSDDVIRRVLLRYPATGSDQEPRVLSQELYRAGKLVYDARFERMQELSHYRLPISIVIENPDKKVLLTVQYTDVEVNTPISEESFVLGDGAGEKENGQLAKPFPPSNGKMTIFSQVPAKNHEEKRDNIYRERSAMNSITLRSPAKINLCLSVLGKRPDGYHEVEMMMQMVGLYDEVTVALAKGA